jgi:hypothetical protein
VVSVLDIRFRPPPPRVVRAPPSFPPPGRVVVAAVHVLVPLALPRLADAGQRRPRVCLSCEGVVGDGQDAAARVARRLGLGGGEQGIGWLLLRACGGLRPLRGKEGDQGGNPFGPELCPAHGARAVAEEEEEEE